jgi:hypothetical protein
MCLSLYKLSNPWNCSLVDWKVGWAALSNLVFVMTQRAKKHRKLYVGVMQYHMLVSSNFIRGPSNPTNVHWPDYSSSWELPSLVCNAWTPVLVEQQSEIIKKHSLALYVCSSFHFLVNNSTAISRCKQNRTIHTWVSCNSKRGPGNPTSVHDLIVPVAGDHM